jgi:hypothetical protein
LLLALAQQVSLNSTASFLLTEDLLPLFHFFYPFALHRGSGQILSRFL